MNYLMLLCVPYVGKLWSQMACINNVTVKPNPRAKNKNRKKKFICILQYLWLFSLHNGELTLIWGRDKSAIQSSMLSPGGNLGNLKQPFVGGKGVLTSLVSCLSALWLSLGLGPRGEGFRYSEQASLSYRGVVTSSHTAWFLLPPSHLSIKQGFPYPQRWVGAAALGLWPWFLSFIIRINRQWWDLR